MEEDRQPKRFDRLSMAFFELFIKSDNEKRRKSTDFLLALNGL